MPSVTEASVTVPAYIDRPAQPGLYLAVFHGRPHATDSMDDWGSNGPLFGPLEFVHTTYAATVRIKFATRQDEAIYFQHPAFPDAHDLTVHEDMLLYNGVYYGDWSAFVANPQD